MYDVMFKALYCGGCFIHVEVIVTFPGRLAQFTATDIGANVALRPSSEGVR